VPGARGIGVVVGAPGVALSGVELPEPISPVVLPGVPPGEVPSALVPLGEMPGVLVVAFGSGAVPFPVGAAVLPIVPPVLFGSSPVVVLGVVGVIVEPPRLLLPPPAPRLELPLPMPALPPVVAPVAAPLEVPAAPPLAPPAPPPPPAASAAGDARITKAAVAVINRFVMSAVMPIHLCVVASGSSPALSLDNPSPLSAFRQGRELSPLLWRGGPVGARPLPLTRRRP